MIDDGHFQKLQAGLHSINLSAQILQERHGNIVNYIENYAQKNEQLDLESAVAFALELENFATCYAHFKSDCITAQSLTEDLVTQHFLPVEVVHEILQPGRPVAAFCKVDEAAADEDCILATVVGFDPSTECYEIEDVESGGSTNSSPTKNSTRSSALRFFVPTHKVKALPMTDQDAVVATEHLVPKQEVWALFPGTTCLYPATIVSTPSRRKKTSDFLVKFRDDDVPSRAVQPKYILLIN